MYRYFALYLIFINIIAFCAYGIDKKRAVRNQWRISEKALLGLALHPWFYIHYIYIRFPYSEFNFYLFTDTMTKNPTITSITKITGTPTKNFAFLVL